MSVPLITLTTDFGDGSPYVAAVKGVLLSACPEVRVIDLSHSIPPQDLRSAAWFLTQTVPWFPPGTIHVIVIDPGVGTGRALLCVEWAGHRLLVPDNGCWTPLLQTRPDPPIVHRLTESRFWREPVSATFHGRDILAPAAGLLASGIEPARLGPRIDRWETIRMPQPTYADTSADGEVTYVDRFGNLITNIERARMPFARPTETCIKIGGSEIGGLVRTYADRPAGTLIALTSSGGFLEIAVVNGSAARLLQVGAGEPVRVTSGLVSSHSGGKTDTV